MAAEEKTLRKPGEKYQFKSVEERNSAAIEFHKCRVDFYYFCENYFYIVHPDEGEILFKPLDFQIRTLDNLLGKCPNSKRHTIVKAGRQSGKCLVNGIQISTRRKSRSYESVFTTICLFLVNKLRSLLT